MNAMKYGVVLGILCCGFSGSIGSIGVAFAQSTNANTTAEHKATLFAELANAANELEAKQVEGVIWNLWFDQSPTAEIRSWLDAGMERRESYDFEAAELHFDKVVEAAPDYAEGHNQRAFIRFLRGNLSAAKTDLDKTLELEPNHFGALSGLFHVFIQQDKQDKAMEMLQKAVLIHPWIQERHSLPKALWPEQYRRIHSPDQGI